jgi:hypothetical protein
MRNVFPILILVFISTLLLNAHCKKDKIPEAVLPPATQEGKNTIGFKVNGEVWSPYAKCNIGADPCGEISAPYGPPNNANNYFSFQVARVYSGHGSSLTISSITPITAIGNKYDSINIEYRTGNGSSLGTGYSKSVFNVPGVFQVNRIDQLNQVISGIFSFKLYNTSGGSDSVLISEGRFDFRMNACICRY